MQRYVFLHVTTRSFFFQELRAHSCEFVALAVVKFSLNFILQRAARAWYFFKIFAPVIKLLILYKISGQ